MKQENTSVYFRCDFGPQYGLGHLMRCISLAQGFQKKSSIETFCLCNAFHEKYQALLLESGMNVITFREKKIGLDFEPADYVDSSQNNITVFDNYDVTFKQMVSYKKKYPKLVAIDDTADRFFNTDIIINPSFEARRFNYLTINSPKLLLGNDYVLLRQCFFKTNTKRKKNHIFMSFGGGDVFRRIKSLLKGFHYIEKQLNNPITIDFVLNVDQDQFQLIHSILSSCKKIAFNYISDSYNLSSVMAQADFAITAGGSTVFELAYLGVPQLIFIIDKNQEVMREVDEKGFGVCLGYIWDVSEKQFENKFFEFLQNKLLKENMSKKGREFIDGKGAERAVNQIMNYYYN